MVMVLAPTTPSRNQETSNPTLKPGDAVLGHGLNAHWLAARRRRDGRPEGSRAASSSTARVPCLVAAEQDPRGDGLALALSCMPIKRSAASPAGADKTTFKDETKP